MLCGAEARCGACLQVCGEKQRFEKLMEHFRNEDNNIDFMVSVFSTKSWVFSLFSFPGPGPAVSGRAGTAGRVLVAKNLPDMGV